MLLKLVDNLLIRDAVVLPRVAMHCCNAQMNSSRLSIISCTFGSNRHWRTARSTFRQLGMESVHKGSIQHWGSNIAISITFDM